MITRALTSLLGAGPRRGPGFAIAALATLAAFAAEARPFAYIPTQNGRVVVIDTATDRIVDRLRTLSGDDGPWGIAAASGRPELYVTHPSGAGGGQVAMLAKQKPYALQTFPAGPGAFGVAMDPDGLRYYVASAETGAIAVWSISGQLLASLDLHLARPMGLVAVHQNGERRLYVAENQGNSVAVVDPVYGRILQRIPVGKEPIGIAADAAGQRVYVGNHADRSLSVIDTAAAKTLGVVPLTGQPYGVAVSPDGHTVYAAGQRVNQRQRPSRGIVSVVDTVTLVETARVAVGKTPIGVSLTPDGRKLYVTNRDSHTVSVIAAQRKTPSRLRTLPVGRGPTGFGSFVGDAAPSASLGDPITDALTNWLLPAFEGWAEAQFFKELGQQPPGPPTQAEINEVLADLQSIQDSLNDINKQLRALCNEFYDLVSQINQDTYTSQKQFLGTIETGALVKFTQFSDAVGDQTLDQVAQNPAILNALQTLITDSYLNSLAVAASQIADPGNPSGTAVAILLSDANSYLLAQIQARTSNRQDIMNVGSWTPKGSSTPQTLSIFDTYDNGLLRQYTYLVVALQQIYTIEQSVLYLKNVAPAQFGNLTLAEPGITDSMSYSAAVAQLTTLFTGRFNSLQSQFATALVSDQGGVSPNLPIPASKAINLAGSWPTDGPCTLFTWQGLLPQGQTGYAGSWNGDTLTAQCALGKDPFNPKTLTLSQACGSPPGNVSYFAWPWMGNEGQLQCANLNPAAFDYPSWSDSFGFTIAAVWPLDPPHQYLGITTTNFGTQNGLPSLQPLAGPLATGSNWNGWGLDLAQIPGGSFNALLQYHGTTGLIAAIAVQENTAQSYQTQNAEMVLSCTLNGPGVTFCAQMQGTSGNSLGTGSSSICIGGDQLTMQYQGANTVTIVYNGNCSY